VLRSGLLTINYHRIGTPDSSPLDRGLWSATPEGFARQVRLYKSHLDVISPVDLPQVQNRRGRYGIITFDDGYRDNFEVALPILRAERATATFFIATGFLDTPRLAWWDEIARLVRKSPHSRIELPAWLPAPLAFDSPDRETAVRTLLRAYKQLPPEQTAQFLEALALASSSDRNAAEGENLWMTWDMVRRLRESGMTIGGHTVHHPVLARMRQDQQQAEILGCARRIEAELGEPMHYFSYPVGGRRSFDAATRVCLRQAGVRYAFSYYGGFSTFHDWDDYDIRRVPVELDTTYNRFRRLVMLPQLFA
jgi:peptidoglycan/xylan/chitin deacetylase (PgdA/CDA1 family)